MSCFDGDPVDGINEVQAPYSSFYLARQWRSNFRTDEPFDGPAVVNGDPNFWVCDWENPDGYYGSYAEYHFDTGLINNVYPWDGFLLTGTIPAVSPPVPGWTLSGFIPNLHGTLTADFSFSCDSDSSLYRVLLGRYFDTYLNITDAHWQSEFAGPTDPGRGVVGSLDYLPPNPQQLLNPPFSQSVDLSRAVPDTQNLIGVDSTYQLLVALSAQHPFNGVYNAFADAWFTSNRYQVAAFGAYGGDNPHYWLYQYWPTPVENHDYYENWQWTFSVSGLHVSFTPIWCPPDIVPPATVTGRGMAADTFGGVTAVATKGAPSGGMSPVSIAINRGVTGNRGTGTGSLGGWGHYVLSTCKTDKPLGLVFLEGGLLYITYTDTSGNVVWGVNRQMGAEDAWEMHSSGGVSQIVSGGRALGQAHRLLIG